MYKYYIFVGVLTVFVISVVVFGFVIAGTPFSTRNTGFDNQRVSDFNNLRYSIEAYYQDNRKLPESLGSLTNEYSNAIYNDPQSGKPYEYKILTNTSYSLCTTFSLDSEDLEKGTPSYYPKQENKHKKGYDCITYKISSPVLNSPTSTKLPSPTTAPANLPGTTVTASFDRKESVDGGQYLYATLQSGDTASYYIPNVEIENIIIINKNGVKIFLDQFESGDQIIIKYNLRAGDSRMYVNFLQNTSR